MVTRVKAHSPSVLYCSMSHHGSNDMFVLTLKVSNSRYESLDNLLKALKISHMVGLP
jgi:hypothetical protein